MVSNCLIIEIRKIKFGTDKWVVMASFKAASCKGTRSSFVARRHIYQLIIVLIQLVLGLFNLVQVLFYFMFFLLLSNLARNLRWWCIVWIIKKITRSFWQIKPFSLFPSGKRLGKSPLGKKFTFATTKKTTINI